MYGYSDHGQMGCRGSCYSLVCSAETESELYVTVGGGGAGKGTGSGVEDLKSSGLGISSPTCWGRTALSLLYQSRIHQLSIRALRLCTSLDVVCSNLCYLGTVITVFTYGH